MGGEVSSEGGAKVPAVVRSGRDEVAGVGIVEPCELARSRGSSRQAWFEPIMCSAWLNAPALCPDMRTSTTFGDRTH
jgi:hypothetical protein